MRNIILAVLAGWLFVTNAWAEHEVDHRYNVRGYVLDEDQQGVGNQEVGVFDGSSLLANGKTDSSGYYSLHLHLHNEDNGRILILRTGDHVAKLRVRFDPGDLHTLRVHDANFIAGELVEGGLGRFRIPPWTYPLAGLIVVGAILIALERRRQKKIKLQHLRSTEKPSSGSHKAKKKRRKRH